MKVSDRLGKEITIGSKLAWASSTRGTYLLKIGEVISMDFKEYSRFDEQVWDLVKKERRPSGKQRIVGTLEIKANARRPYLTHESYVARLPERVSFIEGEESVMIDRAEII